jgi:hypothetical protein
MHDSNSIIKFAVETTVVSLITNNNLTASGEKVRDLGERCQENNISLNVKKNKELMMDYRIDEATVVRVRSFSFLGMHITEGLKWSHHTDIVVRVRSSGSLACTSLRA